MITSRRRRSRRRRSRHRRPRRSGRHRPKLVPHGLPCWLLLAVCQFLDDKVVLCLAILVQTLLDADGSHVDEFQDAGREQVVIVAAEIAIGVEYVVGFMQVAFVGDVAIPEQVLVDLPPMVPDDNQLRDEGYHRDDNKGDGANNVVGSTDNSALIIIFFILLYLIF